MENHSGTEGSMIGVIKGTGACLPGKILDNDTLSQWMDTSDQWIRERTGIARRRVAEKETTVSMAEEAAELALADAGIAARELDLILLSTVSSNVVLPSAACEVQKRIGAVNAVCFDLNAACSGFLFALNTAQAYFHAGMIQKALIIGAECLSNLVDWGDRSTAILFGDGAGAAVLTAQEGELPVMVMHSDGAKGDVLTCKNRFIKGALADIGHTEDLYIRMNGQEVFKFAVRKVPECIGEVLMQKGLSAEEIDYFLLHQANERIVEGIAKRLHVDISRFPMNLMDYGNTSSASIPILLDEVNRKGMLRKGMKLVLAGFGAGLSWGATYVEWDGKEQLG